MWRSEYILISDTERLLFARELGRLQKELAKSNDNQVQNCIHQEILLLLKVLSLTAEN
jgi:hypothetical protein